MSIDANNFVLATFCHDIVKALDERFCADFERARTADAILQNNSEITKVYLGTTEPTSDTPLMDLTGAESSHELNPAIIYFTFCRSVMLEYVDRVTRSTSVDIKIEYLNRAHHHYSDNLTDKEMGAIGNHFKFSITSYDTALAPKIRSMADQLLHKLHDELREDRTFKDYGMDAEGRLTKLNLQDLVRLTKAINHASLREERDVIHIPMAISLEADRAEQGLRQL